MSNLQTVIDAAFENRAEITPGNVSAEVRDAINEAINGLDKGQWRVAEKKVDGQWQTNQWLKKAVLLSFRINDNVVLDGGCTQYFDKVPSKFADYTEADFRAGGFRVVPNAVARRGSYIAKKNVVLMPSYVNIGAFVDEGTMVDTWATVGSCARSARTCTCPVAWVLAAYSNRCKPARLSSKTTALSARVQKWLKA